MESICLSCELPGWRCAHLQICWTRKLQNNQIKRMQNVYGEWGHLWTLSAHICSMVDLVWDAMKSVYFVEIRSVHTVWASLKFWFGKCSSPLSPVPAKAWHFQQITDTWGLIVLTFVWVQLSIFYSKSEGDQSTKVPGLIFDKSLPWQSQKLWGIPGRLWFIPISIVEIYLTVMLLLIWFPNV